MYKVALDTYQYTQYRVPRIAARGMTLAALLLAILPGSLCFLVGAPGLDHSGMQRARVVACDDVESRIDETIGEILDVQREVDLPSLLGKRLDVLTSPAFMERLEDRRASAPPGRREELENVGEAVVSFLEEVTNNLSSIAPEIEAEQSAASAAEARAAEAAEAARRKQSPAAARGTSEKIQRKSVANDVASPATPPLKGVAEAGDESLSPEKREQRARYRHLVERLLDAANTGTEALDQRLREERASLDGGFFEHLRWEVEEQKAKQNSQLLHILEVVVQRACVEVEEGRFDVSLLSALLQTRNADARAEMYERELVCASAAMQATFARLVLDTQLELEKAVLRGEQVDADLLQMLRVISAEAAERVSLP